MPSTSQQSKKHSGAFSHFKCGLALVTRRVQLLEASLRFAKKSVKNQQEGLASCLGVSPLVYPALQKKISEQGCQKLFSDSEADIYKYFILEIHNYCARYLSEIAHQLLLAPVAKVAENIPIKDIPQFIQVFQAYGGSINVSSPLKSIVDLFSLSLDKEQVDEVIVSLKIRNYIAHLDPDGCKEYLKKEHPEGIRKTSGGNVVFDKDLASSIYEKTVSLVEALDNELVEKGLIASRT